MKLHPGSSMYAYQFEQKTQSELLDNKEYGDYKDHMQEIQHKGTKHHLFLGHGPVQGNFEKRDFGTTNDIVY